MPSIKSAIEKKHKLNKTASASVWYIASNLISRGIAFLFTPIFTRLLSPSEYGIYSLYVSLMGVFTVLSTLQMSGNVIYRGFARFEGKSRGEFLSSALGAQIMLSAASILLVSVLGDSLSKITSLDTGLTLLLLLQIFLSGVEGFYLAECRYVGRYKTVAKINFSVGIITPLLSLILIRAGLRGYARIISPLLISLAVAIPIAVKIIREGKRLIWLRGWRYLFKMTLPMLPHFIALSIIAQSDKIIIARTLGEGALGKYSAAYSIGFILSYVGSAFTIALSPWIIKKMKLGKGEEVRECIISVGKMIGYATLLFLAILPELFRLAVPSEYREALPVAYLTALSVLFSFLASAITICILHYEKPMLITKNSLTVAAVTLPLAYLLTVKVGFIGAAFYTFLAYAMLFLLNLRSIEKIEAEKPMVKFSLQIALFLIFSALLFFLRISFAARFLCACAVVLLALPELKECKKLLF